MASADATATAIDLAPTGLDDAFVLIDDIHPVADPRVQLSITASIDNAVRRAFGTSGRGRGGIDQNTGDVTRRASSTSHPALLMSAEESLDVGAAASAFERMLSIQITHASTFNKGGADQIQEAAKSGKFQTAYIGYVHWLAMQIKDSDPDPALAKDAWCARVMARRSQMASDAANRDVTVTSRSARIVGSLSAGIGLFSDFAVSVGAMTRMQRAMFMAASIASLQSAMTAHTAVATDGGLDEAAKMVNQLRSEVFSGRAVVGDDEPSGGQRRIGVISSLKDGTKFVGIDAGAAAAVIGRPMTEQKIKAVLRSVIIPDAKGNISAQVRIGDLRVRCIRIPKDVWDGPAESDD
jgi:hypothetical protein